MDKPIGGFLQASAAFMFFAAGAFGGDAVLLLLPAAISGIAGLHLWSRGAKPALPPTDPPASLERQVTEVQSSLVSLHEEVRQLREGRDFYEQLYPGKGEREPARRPGSGPA
jgi:hypothetical protein